MLRTTLSVPTATNTVIHKLIHTPVLIGQNGSQSLKRIKKKKTIFFAWWGEVGQIHWCSGLAPGSALENYSPGSLREPYVIPGIKLRSSLCKANALAIVWYFLLPYFFKWHIPYVPVYLGGGYRVELFQEKTQFPYQWFLTNRVKLVQCIEPNLRCWGDPGHPGGSGGLQGHS